MNILLENSLASLVVVIDGSCRVGKALVAVASNTKK
jgi:hypothetical protein